MKVAHFLCCPQRALRSRVRHVGHRYHRQHGITEVPSSLLPTKSKSARSKKKATTIFTRVSLMERKGEQLNTFKFLNLILVNHLTSRWFEVEFNFALVESAA